MVYCREYLIHNVTTLIFSQTICIGNIELRGSCLQLQLLVFHQFSLYWDFILPDKQTYYYYTANIMEILTIKLKKGGILCIEENSI